MSLSLSLPYREIELAYTSFIHYIIIYKYIYIIYTENSCIHYTEHSTCIMMNILKASASQIKVH